MIVYFLNGKECNPLNIQEIKYIVNNNINNRYLGIEISTDVLTFVKRDKQKIENWLSNNGYGVGMPFEIHFGSVIQEYYIDFLDSSFEKNSYQISVKIKRRNATNHFFQDADSLPFFRVNWLPSDFSEVDYQVIKDEQASYYLSLALLLLSGIKAGIESAKNLAQAVADLQASLVPSSQTVPPAPVINIPLVISNSLMVIARAVELIAVIAMFIRVMGLILDVILPPVRQFKCLKVRKLIEKSCSFLGYNIQSNWLNEVEPLTVLPVPMINDEAKLLTRLVFPNSLAFNKGFPYLNDTYNTLGQLIDQLEKIYNLRTEVSQNNVVIERQSSFSLSNNSPVPLYFNDQDNKTESRGHNGDFYKRKMLSFSTDPQDIYTFDDSEGLSAENGLEALTTPAPDLDLLRGFENITTGFSRGSRRKEQTFVEKFFIEVAKVIDTITFKNFSGLVKSRVGCLQISEQYFSNTKLLWLEGTRLSELNDKRINARYILDEYHEDIEFAETINDLPVPMTAEEFIFYSDKKFITLENGTVAEVISLEYDNESNVGTFNLEIKTPNLIKVKTTKYE